MRPSHGELPQRRIHHHPPIASENSEAQTSAAADTETTGAAPAAWSHDRFGNELVGHALASQGGLAQLLTSEVTLASCGVSGQEQTLTSNAVMLRALRAAMAHHEARALDRAVQSPGMALPRATLDRMETAFGHDFEHVRVHTDANAAQAAKDLDAHAFALGAHIFFGQGNWAPETRAGDRLLAHELTHVIQDDEGRIPRGDSGVSHPSDPTEQEAYANEQRILSSLSAIDRLGNLASSVSGNANAERAEIEALLRQIEITRGGAVPDAVLQKLGAHFGRTTPTAAVNDADAERAAATAELLGEFAPALGLDPRHIEVRADAEGGRRTTALGARGLAEGNIVYLDPSRFQPETRDGRELLAHELVHVAQFEKGQVDRGPAAAGDALRAETEASSSAAQLASGGATATIHASIPVGHNAADTGAADALSAQAQANNANAQAAGGPLTGAGGAPLTAPSGEPSANREKRVSEYQDGVDGAADALNDEPSFDALCEAVDSENQQEIQGALRRVKGSKPFKDMVGMYRSACLGTEDDSALKSAFNAEFEGRGFWAETEQAFTMVLSAVKAEAAKPDPTQRDAMNKGKQSEQNADKKAENAEAEAGEGGGEPGGEGGAGVDAAAPGDVAARLAEVVEQAPDSIGSIERLKGLDADMAKIEDNYDHQTSYAEAAGGKGGTFTRAGHVMEEIGRGFLGPFVAKFTDQFVDTLVLDTIGTLGDKALNALCSSGGGPGMKVPMIGPAIGLIMDCPFTADYWTGKEGVFSKVGEAGTDAGEGIDLLKQMGSGRSFTDNVGILFCALAEFMSATTKILEQVARLCGTLSAIAFVLSGILYITAAILVWFGGAGAALLPIAAWLNTAGTVLAEINTALGLIAIATAFAAMFFRGIGVLMVPEELYIEQLKALSGDAGKFGELFGAKLGDATATEAKKSAAKRTASEKPPPADGSPEARGRADADADTSKIDKGSDGAETENRKAQDENQQPRDQDENQAPRDTDNAPTAPKKSVLGSLGAFTKRVLVDNTIGPILGAPKALGNALSQARNLTKIPMNASPQEIQRRLAEAEPKLKEAEAEVKATSDKVTQLKTELDAAKADLQSKKMTATADEKAALQQRVTDTQAKLKTTQSELNASAKIVQEIQNQVAPLKNIDTQHTDNMKAVHDKESENQKNAEHQQKVQEAQRARDDLEATIPDWQRDPTAAPDRGGPPPLTFKGRNDVPQIIAVTENGIVVRSHDGRQETMPFSSVEGPSTAKQHAQKSEAPPPLDAATPAPGEQNGDKKTTGDHVADVLTTSSSGNATGGVGSSYNNVLNDLDTFLERSKTVAAGIAGLAGVGAVAASGVVGIGVAIAALGAVNSAAQTASDGTENAEGQQPKPEEKKDEGGFSEMWKTKGDKVGKWVTENIGGGAHDVEQLSLATPPVGLQDTIAAREEAMAAFQAFTEAHIDAYNAYLAEQTIQETIAQTESFIEDGEAITCASEQVAPGMSEGAAKAGEREQKLAGNDLGIEEQDPEAQSTIAGVASRSEDNAEYTESSPDSSSMSGAGDDSANAQNEANETATAGDEAGKAAASQQTQIMESVVSTQQSVEEQHRSNVSGMEGKLAEEKAELNEVQTMKAGYLVERDTYRAEAESKSTEFFTNYDQLKAWSDNYSNLRAGRS